MDARVRAAGLIAEADELEHAIDEAVSDCTVRISGAPTADQIADKVVERLKGVERLKKSAPKGMSPLPWCSFTNGWVRDRDGAMVLWSKEDIDARVIATAVNAYFGPAEASTEIEPEGGDSVPV